MSELAISVENLGKQYRVGAAAKTTDRFGERLVEALSSPIRRAGKILRGQASGASDLDQTFWALRDLTFEIKQGEVVGIIGRNGAGKSTLLKILSRITEPTEGYADLYGRVGSLLEVGSGFHPELTGRENVYLNGGILGMGRQEITRKFDEIVAFAEIDQFIDTPVKHYSSGMYVRLAFSVAAHLESEILLVDEVLAVGDIAFQKKCLGKMEGVADQGRTVLFVSHNMSLIQTLCQRGILIEDGKVTVDSSVSHAANTYIEGLEVASMVSPVDRVDREGSGDTKLTSVTIEAGGNQGVSTPTSGEPVTLIFEVDKWLPGLKCLFTISDNLGRPVAMFQTDNPGPKDVHTGENRKQFTCVIPKLLLLPGRYRLDVLIRDKGGRQDRLVAATYMQVYEGIIDGRPARALNNGVSVSMPHYWHYNASTAG